MKKTLTFLFLQLICYGINAQSAHDNPCGAITIPVIESADPCIPVRDQFTGISYVAYSITGTNTCSPSFANNPDVWYKFTATHVLSKIQIVPAQGNGIGCGNYGVSAAEFVVLTGNCSGPFTLIQCGRSDIANTLTLNNLSIGTEYYIKITAGFGNTCGSLGCCVYTTIPSSSSKVGINTNLPTANLDVAGDAVFRNKVTMRDTLTFDKPLILPSTLGNKISFYGGLSGNHYGIGIQNGGYQFYSDAPAANLFFGYGSSDNFTERARIINQGADAMQLNGRIYLRNGTTDLNNGGGIWL